MNLKVKKGQYTVEYILLFAATVAVIITVVSNPGLLPAAVNGVMDEGASIVETVFSEGEIDTTPPDYNGEFCGDGSCNANEDCVCGYARPGQHCVHRGSVACQVDCGSCHMEDDDDVDHGSGDGWDPNIGNEGPGSAH